MRHRLHNPFPRLPGAAAWLMAWLCLWMGTGGVLHHTDNGPNIAAASARVALSHVTPAAPTDDCAACQWTQGVQSGTFIVCRIVLPLCCAAACACPIPVPFVSRPPRLRCPRAPPFLLS